MSAWLALARLQFHPMAFIAYAMGAAAAVHDFGLFAWNAFWVGYGLIFAIELCTIFTNELFDYETDVRNVNFSPFTGGSRVLVEGRLGSSAVKAGIGLLLCAVAVLGCALAWVAPRVQPGTLLGYVAIGLFLGLGYTAPPLRFCYRGAGELVVGATHSFYVAVGGYLAQTGIWSAPLPWALSVPLFFSVLAAITLAGLPDRAADAAVSKRTLAVALGPRPAIALAGGFALIATASGLTLRWYGLLGGRAGWLITAAVPHGLALLWALGRLWASGSYDRRIDPIMTLALSYILWFGVVPLLSLLFP
jgi:1,4-dihydroxy-2-naphthoate octaprenyltransferase